MKLSKNIFVLILSAGLLAGCSAENGLSNLPSPENYPIQLSSEVTLQRIQDEQIVANRELGFFVTAIDPTAETFYANKKITAKGNGSFNYSESLYYPVSGEIVNFYAIHPFNNNTSLETPMAFSIIADQSDIDGYLNSDLLHSVNEGVARSRNAVPLSFHHKLSKLEFTIKKGVGMDLGSLNTVAVMDILPSTTINLIEGTISAATGDGVEVNAYGVKPTASGETEVSGIEAIVVPQTITSGNKLFKIMIGDVAYYYTPDEDISFLSDKKYKYILTINQTGITVSSTIVNWGTGKTIVGDGEAED